MKTRFKVVAVGLLAMLSTMLGVGTASAHSAVVGSNPGNDASVATGPDQVSVTFNEALQEQFAALTVTGPDGNLWTKSDPAVQGATVSADLGELGPAGTYTIAYRVTSADGHPVSGTIAFTLTEAGNGTPGASAAAATGESDSSSIPVLPFIAVGVVVFGGALFFVLRKPKSS
ncbi:methionine-rich copper-binding protein CopC [Rhodococcus sp. 27YEA15]|uniref:copper resistance CopC family protein n=1 Tax=Rhodococcus sp. 27YEA15 TaxID=3156259 RepID=UPI003C7DDBF4